MPILIVVTLAGLVGALEPAPAMHMAMLGALAIILELDLNQ